MRGFDWSLMIRHVYRLTKDGRTDMQTVNTRHLSSSVRPSTPAGRSVVRHVVLPSFLGGIEMYIWD
jgi:hypothetical protein